MTEEWKPCAGYEDCYMISNLGNLARCMTYAGRPTWKVCTYALNFGYRRYHLSWKGKDKCVFAHILVWRSFMGEIPKGLEINHKNGCRNDPGLSNLEIMTRSENCAHSFQVLGRKKFNVSLPGSSNGFSKLAEKDVPDIFSMRNDGVTHENIAKHFGVTRATVQAVLYRKRWKHVEIPPHLMP